MVDRGAMTPNISIHAPTGGATIIPVAYNGYTLISIHAPTGGATMKPFAKSAKRIFQSTLPRGERQFLFHKHLSFNDFNPRSHGGSDDWDCRRRDRISDFNPRSHGGSDSLLLYKDARCDIFQSTLPRGERHILTHVIPSLMDFNPRSHGGSDLLIGGSIHGN